MVNRFNQELLEIKRKKFFEAVYDFCNARHLPMPALNFDGCPNEDENQLAHYHTDTNKICISSEQMMKLNLDEIYNTATHEAAHITERNHESGFHEEHEKGRIGAFRPPGGVVIIDGGTLIIKPNKKPVKVDKIRCNYHMCGKRAELKQCTHCGGFFCEEHFKSKLPGFPNFSNNTPYTHILMEEFREQDRHPCPGYYDICKAKIEKQKKKYADALNNACAKSLKENLPETRNSRTRETTFSSRIKQPAKTSKILAAAFVLLLIIIVVLSKVFR